MNYAYAVLFHCAQGIRSGDNQELNATCIKYNKEY